MAKKPKRIMTVLVLLALLMMMALAAFVVLGGPSIPRETEEIVDRVLLDETSRVIQGETGFSTSGGRKIWYESIAPQGVRKGVVLLNMSMAVDSLMWPPAFIRAFTDAGYQVVRYDYRGTGMSDWMADWDSDHPYSLTEMANDAISVLDELDVERAHLVGMSLGGMIAQEIAIQNPARVTSLTLISTSGYVGDQSLPGLSASYSIGSVVRNLPLIKYRMMGGEKNLILERIAKMISAGIDFDVQETAEIALFDLRERKGININAVVQHVTATNVSGSRYDALRSLRVPTLIVHGTADSVMPVEHGKKLSELLPHADAMWVDGVGHLLPFPKMDAVYARMVRHLERAQGDDRWRR